MDTIQKQKDKVRVYIPKDENDKVVVNYEEEQKKQQLYMKVIN
ncbi:MAG: hypothetical protein V8S33_07290 [Intestinibacter bartlettii]